MDTLQAIQQHSYTKEEELIHKLQNKDVVLSYSSIKNLTSPVNFMNYKLLDKKQSSDSQKLGTLCDLMLLTPELENQKITVVETVPTTDKQFDFVNDLVGMLKSKVKDSVDLLLIFDDLTTELYEFQEAFNRNYSRSKADSLKHLIPYVKAVLTGKEIVSKELHDEASDIVGRLRDQEEFMEAIEASEYQKKITFEFLGWSFIGYLDTYTKGIFKDLKFASDCSPNKFEYDLRKFHYDVQFGLYSLGLEIMGEPKPDFEFVVYDKVGNYSILPVDESYLSYGQKKVEYLVRSLDKMIEDKAFFSSYNFFNPRARVYKPKWIQGFDFSVFD